MNTKSFVNQLDADNVVKGYYDESDQLVMVEPEGSGGGGLETAELTIVDTAGAFVTLPHIEDGLIDTIVAGAMKTYTFVVPLGAAGCAIEVDDWNNLTIALDGDIAAITERPGHYVVTGDATITLDGK